MSNPILFVNLQDPDTNFWELNPQFKIIEPFAAYYKADKDKAKVSSSQVLFAIGMVYDPASKLKNLPVEDRISLVEEDFLLGKLLLPKNLVDHYVSLTTTAAKRNMTAMENLLDKRTQFLNGVVYTLTTSKEVDALFANTEKIYKALSAAKAEVAKEEGKTSSTKGDQELSLADQGEI